MFGIDVLQKIAIINTINNAQEKTEKTMNEYTRILKAEYPATYTKMMAWARRYTRLAPLGYGKLSAAEKKFMDESPRTFVPFGSMHPVDPQDARPYALALVAVCRDGSKDRTTVGIEKVAASRFFLDGLKCEGLIDIYAVCQPFQLVFYY